ncbi:MAG: hypothetical protein QM499_01045 [Flavobacteriaceae bacterium]
MDLILKDKFRKVIIFDSDYSEPNESGLKRIILRPNIKVDSNTTIRLDIWLCLKNFYNKDEKEHISMKHQVLFELKNNTFISKKDILSMFKFTQKELFLSKINPQDKQSQTIQGLYPNIHLMPDVILLGLIEDVKDSLYPILRD